MGIIRKMTNESNCLENHIDEIINSKFSLILLPEKESSLHIVSIVYELNKRNENILYICFAKTFIETEKTLINHGIDTSNIIFIDCISETPKSLCPGNCCSLQAPDIDSLLSEITSELKKKDNTFLIFDTVSALLMYEHKSSILKFTNTILSREEMGRINNLYLIIKDAPIKKDDQNDLLNDLRMLTDKEINII